MAEIQMIKELAKRLNLQHIFYGAIDLEKPEMGNCEFLCYVLREELRMREEKAVFKKMKASKLPKCRFEKEYTGVTSWQINEIKKLKFLENDSNIFIVGKCGAGKTSLACEIGKTAIDGGYKVYYIKMEELISTMREKELSAKSKSVFSYMKECDLIIIDETMYTKISDPDLAVFYKAVSFLGESRSLCVVTNRGISHWKEACEDKHLMETIIARLTQNTQILSLEAVHKEYIDYPDNRNKRI
ncbi:MAG: ATP-binding protein [Bacillota bacterium]